MAKKQTLKTTLTPKTGRPNIPGYGIAKSKKGLLPWKWALDRLRKSRQYWIATTRPDGAPHVMVIWGLWLEDGFYFSTGKNSRKARNLAVNPRCVVCSDDSAEAVIVEGVVESVGTEKLRSLFAAYKKKYEFDVSGMGEPFYRIRPRVAFGLLENKFTGTATRWMFS
jgi:Pyridoxamine 5'-phosphate oxidase